MLFEESLSILRAGGRVRRASWDQSRLYLEIQTKGSIAEVYLMTSVGMEWPYHCFRLDLLATDWTLA